MRIKGILLAAALLFSAIKAGAVPMLDVQLVQHEGELFDLRVDAVDFPTEDTTYRISLNGSYWPVFSLGGPLLNFRNQPLIAWFPESGGTFDITVTTAPSGTFVTSQVTIAPFTHVPLPDGGATAAMFGFGLVALGTIKRFRR